MEAVKPTRGRRSTHANSPSSAFRMLEFRSECDDLEITRVHDEILSPSLQLTELENKYHITDFNSSKNIKNYPQHERAKVLRLWSDVYRGAMDLDYLFIDEDLYPSEY